MTCVDSSSPCLLLLALLSQQTQHLDLHEDLRRGGGDGAGREIGEREGAECRIWELGRGMELGLGETGEGRDSGILWGIGLGLGV